MFIKIKKFPLFFYLNYFKICWGGVKNKKLRTSINIIATLYYYIVIFSQLVGNIAAGLSHSEWKFNSNIYLFLKFSLNVYN